MGFGDKLVEARKGRGLSQEQLAGKLGVSRQAISRWEAGNVLPDVTNLKKISELFEISMDYLLDDDCTQERDREAVRDIRQNQEKKLYRLSLFLVLSGVIGISILILLSSQIPAVEMKPLVTSDVAQVSSDQREADEILYVRKKVYALFPFLDYYHLNVIAAGFVIMVTGGVILLIYVKRASVPCRK